MDKIEIRGTTNVGLWFTIPELVRELGEVDHRELVLPLLER